GALLNEQAAVEQHADGLDGIERNAFGADEDSLPGLGRQTRYEPRQKLLHGRPGKRLEAERRDAALTGTPGRPPLEQLRACQREQEGGRVAGPVEQVLEEVEETGVCPLHVFEGENGRIGLRQPLEEESPRGEQILLVAGLVLGQAEEMGEPGLEEA